VRSRRLELLDYRPSDPQSEDLLVPPGSITLFLARQGSNLLGEIRQAVTSDRSRDVELARRLRDIYRRRKMVSLERAVEMLRAEDVFAEIQHGRFVLASSLFVPQDLEVAMVPLPYNGGPISRSGFHLLERIKESSDAALDGFLVRHSPALTRAELAALKLVPREVLDFNVGKAAMCYAITGVALVAVVIFATSACPGKIPDFHLDDDIIRRLGPEATARQLLGLRRKALEHRV
jgi:hypothetical protein